MRKDPATAPFADQFDALDAEFETRSAAVAAMPAGPAKESAMQALEDDVTKRQAAIASEYGVAASGGFPKSFNEAEWDEADKKAWQTLPTEKRAQWQEEKNYRSVYDEIKSTVDFQQNQSFEEWKSGTAEWIAQNMPGATDAELSAEFEKGKAVSLEAIRETYGRKSDLHSRAINNIVMGYDGSLTNDEAKSIEEVGKKFEAEDDPNTIIEALKSGNGLEDFTPDEVAAYKKHFATQMRPTMEKLYPGAPNLDELLFQDPGVAEHIRNTYYGVAKGFIGVWSSLWGGANDMLAILSPEGSAFRSEREAKSAAFKEENRLVSEQLPDDPRMHWATNAAVMGATQAPANIATAFLGVPVNLAANTMQMVSQDKEANWQAISDREAKAAGSTPEQWEKSLTPQQRERFQAEATWKALISAVPNAVLETAADKLLIGKVPWDKIPGGKWLKQQMAKMSGAKPKLALGTRLLAAGVVKSGMEGAQEVWQQGTSNLARAATISGDFSSKSLAEGMGESFVGGAAGGAVFAPLDLVGEKPQATPEATQPNTAPILPEQIAAAQSEIAASPAADRVPAMAAAMKLITGTPLDALTKAEQDAVKPHFAKVNGEIVITDDIISEMAQTSPTVVGLMQTGNIRDEATRRQEILFNENTAEQDTPTSVPSTSPSPQQQGISTDPTGTNPGASGANRQQAQDSTGQVAQTAPDADLSVSRGTAVEQGMPLPVGKPSVAPISEADRQAAGDLQEALVRSGAEDGIAKEFANHFVTTRGSDGWTPQVKAKAVRDYHAAAKSSSPIDISRAIHANHTAQEGTVKRIYDELVSGLEKNSPKKSSARKIARKVADKAVRWNNALQLLPKNFFGEGPEAKTYSELTSPEKKRFEFAMKYRLLPEALATGQFDESNISATMSRQDGGGMAVIDQGILQVSIPDLLAKHNFRRFTDSKAAELTLQEEAFHKIGISVLADMAPSDIAEGLTTAREKADAYAANIWSQLPTEHQLAVEKVRGQTEKNDAASGHEYLRLIAQGRLGISKEGKLLDENRKILTEQTLSPSLVSKIQKFLQQIIKTARGIASGISDLDPQLAKEINDISGRMVESLRSSQKTADEIRNVAYREQYESINSRQRPGTEPSGDGRNGPADRNGSLQPGATQDPAGGTTSPPEESPQGSAGQPNEVGSVENAPGQNPPSGVSGSLEPPKTSDTGYQFEVRFQPRGSAEIVTETVRLTSQTLDAAREEQQRAVLGLISRGTLKGRPSELAAATPQPQPESPEARTDPAADPAEANTAEPARASPKRKSSSARPDQSSFPIIAWLEEHGGIQSKKKAGTTTGGEYEQSGGVRKYGAYAKLIYGNGMPADVAVTGLVDAGLMPEGSNADDLWEAIDRELAGAKKTAAREEALSEDERLAEQFMREFREATAKGEGKIIANTADMQAGQIIDAGPSGRFLVDHITEAGDVILVPENAPEDGIRTQIVEAGTSIYLSSPIEGGMETPFSIADTPTGGIGIATVERAVRAMANRLGLDIVLPRVRVVGNITDRPASAQASNTSPEDIDFARRASLELAKHDEIFRYPVTTASTLEGVFADVFPDAKYLGEDTRPDERQESQADRRFVFQLSGKTFYVYEQGRDVWIDVSRLEEGDGGSAIYAAVGNYAHNTRRDFVGDPNGVSETAVIRRTSAMLSLALRFGSTNFLEASPEQIEGNPEKGIAPLVWSGNSAQRTNALLKSFLGTISNRLPGIQKYRFDFDSGLFLDPNGRPIGSDVLQDTSRYGFPRAARAGESTLRRGIFLQSLVESQSGERSELLEKLLSGQSALLNPAGLSKIFSRRNASGQIEGYYDPRAGEIVINASAISSPRRAGEVFLHEAVGHGGMSAALRGINPKGYENLSRLLQNFKRDDGSSLWADVQTRYPGANDETLFDEALARLAENPQRSEREENLFKRIVDAIRNWLTKRGFSNWTPADVDALIRRSAEAARREFATQEKETRYSRLKKNRGQLGFNFDAPERPPAPTISNNGEGNLFAPEAMPFNLMGDTLPENRTEQPGNYERDFYERMLKTQKEGSPSEKAEATRTIERLERIYPSLNPQLELPATAQPEPAKSEWTTFPPESGSLGIPRDEMPQVPAAARGALVNFLKARGIEITNETVPATSLKPSQAEFNQDKVDKARELMKGTQRKLLVSSDNYLLDGHHQWLASEGKDVEIARLSIPAKEALAAISELPSTNGGEMAAELAPEQPSATAAPDILEKSADAADSPEYVNTDASTPLSQTDSIRDTIRFRPLEESEIDESLRARVELADRYFSSNVVAGQNGGDGRGNIRAMGIRMEQGGSPFADFTRGIEELFRKRVVFVAGLFSEIPSGFTFPKRFPDTVFLNVEGKHPAAFLLGHEFGHSLQAGNESLYKDLSDFVLNRASDWSDYASKNLKGYSPDRHPREFVNDFIGSQFNDPTFWKELAGKDGPLFDRVIRAAIAFLNSITGRVSTLTRDVRPYFANIEEVRSKLIEALRQYRRVGDISGIWNPVDDSELVAGGPRSATIQESPVDRAAARSYAKSVGASNIEDATNGITRTLSFTARGRVGESGSYVQSDLFGEQGTGSTGTSATAAGKTAAGALRPAKAGEKPTVGVASADLIAGLQGDWEALAREIDAKGRASSIFADLVNNRIPDWDVTGTKILSPEDVLAVMQPIRSPYFESLKVMVLDGNNNVAYSQILHVGSVNESIADSRRIFSALARLREQTGKNYSRIIISHNHPSGDPSPSSADRRLQIKLDEVATATGWDIADHVITNGETYFSFREAGIGGTSTPGKEYTPRKDTGKPAPKHQAFVNAPWEAVHRSGLALMDEPKHVAEAAKFLRNANPDSAHILYVNTKLKLLAVERMSLADFRDTQKRNRAVMAGMAREGGYGFFVEIGGDAPTPQDRSDAKNLREFASSANMIFLDFVITDTTGKESGQPFFSFSESGLMEDATAYGTRVNDEQVDFNFLPEDKPAAKADATLDPLDRFKSELPQAMRIAAGYDNIPGVDLAEAWVCMDHLSLDRPREDSAKDLQFGQCSVPLARLHFVTPQPPVRITKAKSVRHLGRPVDFLFRKVNFQSRPCLCISNKSLRRSSELRPQKHRHPSPAMIALPIHFFRALLMDQLLDSSNPVLRINPNARRFLFPNTATLHLEVKET